MTFRASNPGQRLGRFRSRAFPALALFFTVILTILAVAAGQMAVAETDEDGHRAGFSYYGQVDRGDGTYRQMLVDDRTLRAMQEDEPLGDGATILMESYYRPGEIGSIFAKRFEGGRWLYGSFGEGEPMPAFSPRPQCSFCHRTANDLEGTFTLPMLERFARTGVPQRTSCGRTGRSPCKASVYAGN